MGTQCGLCVQETERYAPDDNGSGVFKAIAETPPETKEQIPANYVYKKKEKWFISTWMSVSQVSILSLALASQLISFLFSPQKKIFKEFGRDLDAPRRQRRD